MSGLPRHAHRPGAAVFNSVLSFVTLHMNRCIDGLRAGNRDAANELVRRAEGRFRQLAHRMYRRFPNVRPVAEPDDVIQVGWMRLLRSLEKLRPANTARFFLLASVELRRELLDLARKAKTAKYQVRPLVGAGVGGGSASEFQVAEPADRTDDDIELWERFHAEVENLEEDLRNVVTLVFYDGRSKAEAAAILGKDPRTISRWWREACIELRTRVGEAPEKS